MVKLFKQLLVVLAIFLFIGIINTVSNTYTREGVVVWVNEGIATVEDGCGFLWDIETTDLIKGQAVKMVMSENNTDHIDDDSVLKYEVIK